MVAAVTDTNIEQWGTLALVVVLVGGNLLRLIAAEWGWPRWLVRHVERLRGREIHAVLDELGLRDQVREALNRQRFSQALNEAVRVADPETRAKHLVALAFHDGDHVVGHGNQITFPYFVDAMSASLRDEYADRCASTLLTYLGERHVERPEDIVVGIKQGSPLLAANIAGLLGLPLVLFRGVDESKYVDAAGAKEFFDGDLESSRCALIVDDSATSGRRIIACARELRRRGLTVHRALVLFEPVGKNPSGELQKNDLELIAPVILDDATLAEIRRLATHNT